METQVLEEIIGKNESFDKKYKLHSIIGSGCSGYTILAELVNSSKPIAIKYITNESIGLSKMSLKQFKSFAENEITIQYNCKHVNVCRAYGYHLIDKNYAVILELCKNGNLNDFLSKLNLTTFSEEFTGYIAYQIIQGLQYLRQVNVTHFDLKEENLLIDEFFKVKISDFSVSRRIRAEGKFRLSGYGTDIYTSPENAQCEDIDSDQVFKSDIYSLGVIIYRLIYGRNPYDISFQDSKEEKMKKMKNREIQFPDKKISNELKICLRKMLEKNYKNRISIEELVKMKWVKNLDLVFRNPQNDSEFIEDLLKGGFEGFFDQLTFSELKNCALEGECQFRCFPNIKRRKSATSIVLNINKQTLNNI